jgi:hypothetical protein
MAAVLNPRLREKTGVRKGVRQTSRSLLAGLRARMIDVNRPLQGDFRGFGEGF